NPGKCGNHGGFKALLGRLVLKVICQNSVTKHGSVFIYGGHDFPNRLFITRRIACNFHDDIRSLVSRLLCIWQEELGLVRVVWVSIPHVADNANNLASDHKLVPMFKPGREITSDWVFPRKV